MICEKITDVVRLPSHFSYFSQEFGYRCVDLVSAEATPLYGGVEEFLCDLARQKQVTVTLTHTHHLKLPKSCRLQMRVQYAIMICAGIIAATFHRLRC
jgi:hypothetical protein